MPRIKDKPNTTNMETTMWLFLLSLITADAMPSAEYGQLTSTLEEASFSSDQLRILRSLPSDTSLTMSQSIALLEEFSFDNDKLNALRIIAPYISDQPPRKSRKEKTAQYFSKANTQREPQMRFL